MLQEASQSGKLDEALELLKQEQQEVIRAAPEVPESFVALGSLFLNALDWCNKTR